MGDKKSKAKSKSNDLADQSDLNVAPDEAITLQEDVSCLHVPEKALLRRIQVEPLGTGVANMLGEAVGGVVDAYKTITAFVFAKKAQLTSAAR